MLLLADIGGTHTRLCVASQDTLGEVSVFHNADYDDLTALTRAYLADVSVACSDLQGRFAVACPVDSDEIRLTNRDWDFTISGLRDDLGLRSLHVCNDFSALALSLPQSEFRDVLITATYIVVVFSIVMQGLTFGRLVRSMHVPPDPEFDTDAPLEEPAGV